MNTRKFFLIISLIMLVAAASDAFACDCVVSSPKMDFERASAVFFGDVIDIKDSFLADGEQSWPANEVKFNVQRIWKGALLGKNVVVTTVADDGLCGFRFKKGENYLVYTNGENHFTTSICNQTKLLADAAEDLAVLGEGKSPVANSDENSVSPKLAQLKSELDSLDLENPEEDLEKNLLNGDKRCISIRGYVEYCPGIEEWADGMRLINGTFDVIVDMQMHLAAKEYAEKYNQALIKRLNASRSENEGIK